MAVFAFGVAAEVDYAIQGLARRVFVFTIMYPTFLGYIFAGLVYSDLVDHADGDIHCSRDFEYCFNLYGELPPT